MYFTGRIRPTLIPCLSMHKTFAILFFKLLISFSYGSSATKPLPSVKCSFEAPLPIVSTPRSSLASPSGAASTTNTASASASATAKNLDFKSYKIRKTMTVTTEEIELKDSTLFSISRGGCNEYGEDLNFEFDKKTFSAKEMRHWLLEISASLKIVLKENEEKNGALLEKAEAIRKLADDKVPYTNGDSIKVGKDTFEVYVSEGRPGKLNAKIEVSSEF